MEGFVYKSTSSVLKKKSAYLFSEKSDEGKPLITTSIPAICGSPVKTVVLHLDT
jgi:hypothetical protein